MKKKYLFILLFLVSLFFIGGNFISVQASTSEIEQTIINETDFSNNYEKILTEEIVDVILNNGEMYQIQLFSVEEQGIQFYKKRSQAYNELVKRDDAGTVLLQKYLNFKNIQIPNNNDINIIFLEILLNQNEISAKLTNEQTQSLSNSRNENNDISVQRLSSSPITPNGNPVTAFQRGEWLNDYQRAQIRSQMAIYYPNAYEEGIPTTHYNCHSYAWYNPDKDMNKYWINYPNEYINDSSYDEVENPRVGDILSYWAYGEHYTNGYYEFGYYISHSAIILSIESGFNKNNITTLNKVDLISKWGTWGLYTHKGDESPYTESAAEFSHIEVYRPLVDDSYTLGNYSSIINAYKNIYGSSTSETDKYAMYELNVTYTKNYEIYITSTNKLDVRLYDESMQLVQVSDLNSNNNIVHIIKNLSIGTYYLRVAHEDTSKSGTINTKIVSRNTQYLLYNQENDILINYYNNINSYYYINTRGAGFYKIILTATKVDGTTVTYPNEAIIVKDHMDAAQEYKYNVLGYSKLAENDSGINSFYMYLPRNGYFYIHIDMPVADYSNITLSINPTDSITIDMMDRMASTFTEELFDKAEIGDYAKTITINQTGKFTIDFSTVDNINGDITLILLKREYNSSTGSYYKIDKYAQYMNNSNKTRSVTLVLDPGTYYIGYFNNLIGANITATLTRVLQNPPNMTTAMVADPGIGYSSGSEVRFNNGQFGNHSITEGFTRNLYFIPESGTLPSLSRLDYDWYSSNPSVAIVSQYGTVFANAVTSDTTVTIYAVYKLDPSLVYTRTFNILNDTSQEIIVIERNMTYSYSAENGTYQIELNETNCPYPWIQYYTWSVFVPCQENDILVIIGQWGHITSTGSGYAELTGHYTINPRVNIKINLTITD